MSKRRELAGERFGRLTVTGYSHTSNGKAYWDCSCDCGGTKKVVSSSLTGGVTRSCGCLHAEATRRANTRHGLTGHPVYQTWRRMKSRCENPSNNSYRYYGEQGIGLCEQWQSFPNFYADMAPSYAPGLTIERIDNNRGYSPDNCRWATPAEQARNRSMNHMVTIESETLCLAEQARRYGISINTARWRACRGWTDEEIIFGRAK